MALLKISLSDKRSHDCECGDKDIFCHHAATTQGFYKERSVVVLAVAHPWASAPSYLSSQSLAAPAILAATFMPPRGRPTHSRRSPSCRFLLCRVALVCLVLRRRRRLPIPCSRGFSRLSAQLCPPRGIFWPLEFIELSSREDDSSDAH